MRIAFRAGLSSDSDWIVLMALSSLTHHSSPARPGSASLAAVIDWENHRNIEILKIGVSTVPYQSSQSPSSLASIHASSSEC